MVGEVISPYQMFLASCVHWRGELFVVDSLGEKQQFMAKFSIRKGRGILKIRDWHDAEQSERRIVCAVRTDFMRRSPKLYCDRFIDREASVNLGLDRLAPTGAEMVAQLDREILVSSGFLTSVEGGAGGVVSLSLRLDYRESYIRLRRFLLGSR